MSKLYVPGQEDATVDGYVPEEVRSAVAKALEMGESARLTAAGLAPASTDKALRTELLTKAMAIRRNVDNADQFELLMATAYRSGDMESSIRNLAERADAGTLIKPNSTDYSHRKEALTKGTLSDHASRAERRRWAKLQRKRDKRAEKIKRTL